MLIIDRHAGPSLQTRALGVQARTLEIYAQLGIIDRALELGKRGTGGNFWAQGRKMARIPLGDAGRYVTPYPFILILGQDDNERIMGDKLRELGVSVQWNTELIGLAQQSDKVTATLRLPDGRIENSSPRGSADATAPTARARTERHHFPRRALRTRVLCCRFGGDWEHGSGRGQRVPIAGGFHLFFPMRGKDHWRIVGILPPSCATALT